jgi:hypothetical protein
MTGGYAMQSCRARLLSSSRDAITPPSNTPGLGGTAWKFYTEIVFSTVIPFFSSLLQRPFDAFALVPPMQQLAAHTTNLNQCGKHKYNSGAVVPVANCLYTPG